MRRSSFFLRPGLTAALLLAMALLPTWLGVLAAPTISAVSEGNWHGTWAYENRDQEFAFFFRQEGDRLSVRVFHRNRTRLESFLTDWNGHADYLVGSNGAVFDFTITRFDEDMIEGTWHWRTPLQTGFIEEKATVQLQRYEDGRLLIATFPDLLKTQSKEGQPDRSRAIPTTWSFRKVSKRVIRQEELPF